MRRRLKLAVAGLFSASTLLGGWGCQGTDSDDPAGETDAGARRDGSSKDAMLDDAVVRDDGGPLVSGQPVSAPPAMAQEDAGRDDTVRANADADTYPIPEYDAFDAGRVDTDGDQRLVDAADMPDAFSAEADTVALDASVDRTGASDVSAADVSNPGDAGPARDSAADAAREASFVLRVLDDAEGKTTRSILAAQGDDCLACAERSGCLDPSLQGCACEEAAGDAPASCSAVLGTTVKVSEAKVCLAVLQTIFTSRCGDQSLTSCLCGTVDPASCEAASQTPAGAVLSGYLCDFGTTSMKALFMNATNPAFGAGQANALAQCLSLFECSCYP